MNINLDFLEVLSSKYFLPALLTTFILALWKVFDIVLWLVLNVAIIRS
jgi:hypothetical protein